MKTFNPRKKGHYRLDKCFDLNGNRALPALHKGSLKISLTVSLRVQISLLLLLDGEEDGQGTWNKRGLGYHGQKIVFAAPRPSVGPPPQPPAPGGIRISSVYSRPEQLDQPKRVERSNPKVYVKFRDQPIKFLAAGIEGGNRNIDKEYIRLSQI